MLSEGFRGGNRTRVGVSESLERASVAGARPVCPVKEMDADDRDRTGAVKALDEVDACPTYPTTELDGRLVIAQ